MSLREAAQQALDALEYLDGYNGWVDVGEQIASLQAALSEDAMQRLADEQQMIERGTKAWAGVRDATAWLEELRGNEPMTDFYEKAADHIADATKIVEPVATVKKMETVDPVAWMVYTMDGQSAFVTDNPADFAPEHRALPLYTSPPKREPLTDEEISEIFIYHGRDKETFVRAIERAHGIGG